jgi:tetratricopeptide (TPR) repeat protein
MAPEIMSHLETVLGSDPFARSQRLKAFLRWVVEQHLAGRQSEITERRIAQAVYERGPDFDAKLDGTVRSEAIRLRNKLREYYDTCGDQPQRIEIPKGSYVPKFIGFETPTSKEPKIPVQTRRFLWMRAEAAVLVPLLAGLVFWAALKNDSHDKIKVREVLDRANRLITIGEFPAARDVLGPAISLDPSNAYLHLVYSQTLQDLGYDAQALDEAQRAHRLAVASPDGRELEFEARLRAARQDWPGAVHAYNILATQNPGRVDLQWAWANSQLAAHDLTGCVQTLEAARGLPGAAQNPELLRLQALCLASEDRLQDAMAALSQSEAAARATEGRSALARSILLEGGIRQNRGENSLPYLHQARDMCAALRDEICVVRSERVEGNLLAVEAKYTEAARMYRSALEVAQRLGNRGEIENLTVGIGLILTQTGDLERAGAEYGRLTATSTQARDGGDLPGMRASLALLRGDLSEAEVLFEDKLQFEQDRAPGEEASARIALAQISLERADFSRAQDLLRRAGQLIESHSIPELGGRWHTQSARVESALGRPAEALAEIIRAQAIPDVDRVDWMEASRTALEIHADAGDYSFVLSHAPAAIEMFTKAAQPADLTVARALLAEAYFQSGDWVNGRHALSAAQAGLRPGFPFWARLEVLKTEIMASETLDSALRASGEAIQFAESRGLAARVFSIRLAFEERRISLQPKGASGLLAALGDDAARAGYLSVAERARHLAEHAADYKAKAATVPSARL